MEEAGSPRNRGGWARACVLTGLRAEPVSTPAPRLPRLRGPLCPRGSLGLWYPDPRHVSVTEPRFHLRVAWIPAAAGSRGCAQPWPQALPRVRSPVLSLRKSRLRGPCFSCLGLPRRLGRCPSPFRLWTLNKACPGSVPPLRLGLRLNAVMTRSPGRADWGRAVGPGIQVSALRAGGE